MHTERASQVGFRDTFVTLFAVNYWLREFPWSAITNRLEFRCQRKQMIRLTTSIPAFTLFIEMHDSTSLELGLTI